MTQKFAVGLLTFVISALYAVQFVNRGWVPHDEGLLAQSAVRILEGEIPHRDYDESYTGGLSYFHALAFRLAGVRLVTLRYFFYPFFLLFIITGYVLAARWLPPAGAGMATLLLVAWSVPNYFASMPSWYVLFLGTFATFALVKFLSDGRRQWIFVAGLCGGLSLLVIIVGLYVVAASLLFLFFREQADAVESSTGPRVGLSPSPFFLFQSVFCLVFLGILLTLLSNSLMPMEVCQFLIPNIAVTGVLLGRAWIGQSGGFTQRLNHLIRLVVPYVSGILLPVGAFVGYYFFTRSMPDLWRGLFILPWRQIEFARMSLPPLATLIFAVPYAILLVAPASWVLGRAAILVVASGLLALLLLSDSPPVYRGIWNSARSLPGLAVVGGCAFLLRSSDGVLKKRRSEELFLLLAMTALLGLVQFPFAAPIYFCFMAPFLILSLVAMTAGFPRGQRALHGIALVFYLLFAVFRLNHGYIWKMGLRYDPYRPLAMLKLERGGLRVPASDQVQYERLVSSIRQHSRGSALYATPDCPEVYFLSGKRNPTRTAFDFRGSDGRPEILQDFLAEANVRVVVLNLRPGFSRRVSFKLQELLASAFPKSEVIGHFILRWRD